MFTLKSLIWGIVFLIWFLLSVPFVGIYNLITPKPEKVYKWTSIN